MPSVSADGLKLRTAKTDITENDQAPTNLYAPKSKKPPRPNFSGQNMRDSSIIESFLLSDPFAKDLDGDVPSRRINVLKIVRAIFFILILLYGSIGIQTSQYLGLIFLAFGNRLFYRKYMMFTQRLFGIHLCILSSLFSNCRIRLSGQFSSMEKHKISIFLANHQIYTDWWWFWVLAYHLNGAESIKIILKDTLKGVPIFGWGMQFFEFIFFARKWEIDREVLFTNLNRAKNDGVPMWLLIYPEGTIITEDTLHKTKVYAEKTNLTDNPHYVLIPKATGLYHCINALQPDCDYIYDITVGYQGSRQDIFPYLVFSISRSFFDPRGKGPKSIHYHIAPIKVSEIPGINSIIKLKKNSKELEEMDDKKEKEAFFNWLRKRYELKDEMLHYFHLHGHFPEDEKTYVESGVSSFDSQKDKLVFEKPIEYHTHPSILDSLILFGVCYISFKLIWIIFICIKLFIYLFI